jgi:hypothetical protein
MNDHPARRQGVEAHAAGEEWFLHDASRSSVHVINRTAKFVWDLCDGTKTPADIESAIRSSYEVDADQDVRGMVEAILLEFAALGVLTEPE